MKKYIFTLFLFFHFIYCTAQSDQNPNSCLDTIKTTSIQWASLGIGAVSDFNNYRGINFGLSYHWKTKSLTYKTGISHSAKLSGMAINDLNFGLGKSIVHRFYVFCLAAGPGIVWGKEFNSSISLVGQFEIVFTPIKNLGFGVELFSNINNANNLFGSRIIIHLNDKKYN